MYRASGPVDLLSMFLLSRRSRGDLLRPSQSSKGRSATQLILIHCLGLPQRSPGPSNSLAKRRPQNGDSELRSGMTSLEEWSPSKRTIVGKNVKISGGGAEDALNCSSLPRFVLLRHEMPARAEDASHWDFMLECAHSLVTFRWDRLPSNADGPSPSSVTATRIADHRPLYLDYEGEISNNRGKVARVLSGHFLSLTAKATSEADDLMNCRLDFWTDDQSRTSHPPIFQLWIPHCELDQECGIQVLSWQADEKIREANS